ncbi:FecR family protein [Chitinophaga nivalis]|uniref:DUF4974 domain-containing protein n=1 Tax=Chitinophaga nivalis TaxID=2991709 RepID=A0ABT3ISA7_9BACT|nr:FecR family protein [Chitinophaga nivalis]MCW3463472.1 DUF4974 domain-containing protein [Chitinophaga nivalis]MCW3486838.1 DUF4974 domain-containing protein [Chitinophaga nivalis]
MQDRLSELFHKYINDNCSGAELAELFELFSLTENETTVKALITQTIEDINQHPAQINTFLSTGDAEKILSKILPNTHPITTETNIPPRVSSLGWWYWTAAAMVAVLIGLSGYYYVYHASRTPSAQITPADRHNISGNNKATLILHNGQTIALDSVQNGLLATQGAGRVVKTKTGEIIYSAAEKEAEGIMYNNITTPRGGQYSLQLSDGSKVWLNAASSIRFPVVFPASERKVYITGEAYFEIAHLTDHRHQAMPFIVESDNKYATNGSYKVEVLGTKFNINAYSNEPFVSTTLLEGKVKVHAYNTMQSRVLFPNQQVNITPKGEMNLTTPADPGIVIAWKNGYTQFSAVPLSVVMRQIERWYDVNVQFEDHITDVRFTGKLKRNESLSEFLRILDLNDIQYEISNSTIVIKNKK